MTTSLPMHFLVVVFAGWLNRQQQAVIEYLKTERLSRRRVCRGFGWLDPASSRVIL